jgi:DNA-binding CsgD family transcriptional regulator
MAASATGIHAVSYGHKLLLTLYFLLVLWFAGDEAYEELAEMGSSGVRMESLGEFLVLMVTLGGLFYLFYLYFRQKREKAELALQLGKVREQLETSNARFREGKKAFSKLIQWQFDEWGLTPSEQQVAHLLLKGLAFREIAELRNTKDKTVRQQATAIYTKAGLNGRNELAAWFFEDLL